MYFYPAVEIEEGRAMVAKVRAVWIGRAECASRCKMTVRGRAGGPSEGWMTARGESQVDWPS